MFKLGWLALPKSAPNNDKNLLGDYESIFNISDDQEKEWDPSTYVQSIHGLKPKVCIAIQYSKVHGLWECDEEDAYETHIGH